MKRIHNIIIVLWSIIFLVMCKKEEVTEREYPRLRTLPVSEISVNGARFNAEFINRGDFEVLNFGFVWDTDNSPTIENSDKIIYSKDIKEGSFSAIIYSALNENLRYYVRSFAETSDYIVYGTQQSFISLGCSSPKIISFFPESGTWRDTINICGKNFSYLPGSNKVRFNEMDSPAISSTDSSISVLVPPILNADQVEISVTVSGNTAYAPDSFSFEIPEITSCSPLFGTYLDTMVIKGRNFNPVVGDNTILIGQYSAEILFNTSDSIVIIIPEQINNINNVISINTAGYTLKFGQEFILNAPEVSHFIPDTLTKHRETFTIYGKNFCPLNEQNSVFIGGYKADVLESYRDSMLVTLPYQVIPWYYVSVFENLSVQTTVADQLDISNKEIYLKWHSTWTRKNDAPFTGRKDGVAFASNGKGYFGTGQDKDYYVLNDFWEYTPEDDIWTRVADLPAEARTNAVAFELDDKGYVGLGANWTTNGSASPSDKEFRDFYRYDPLSNTWTEIAEYGGHKRCLAASFTINNVAFVGTGLADLDTSELRRFDWYADFWKYDPEIDQWTQVSNCLQRTYRASGFSINGTGYIYDYSSLYKYDHHEWGVVPFRELKAIEGLTTFTVGEKAYIGLHEELGGSLSNVLWEFDPVASSDAYSFTNIKKYGASVFVINEKAYIIGGHSSINNYGSGLLQDVWEFDPSKPELE